MAIEESNPLRTTFKIMVKELSNIMLLDNQIHILAMVKTNFKMGLVVR